MTQKNSYTFIRKWILIGFVSALAMLAGLAVYLNNYWRPIVTERIKETIHTSTDGLYRIDFENVRVNFISGRMTIKNIRFAPDTQIYNKMKLLGTAPKHVYKLEIAELILKKIQPWKIYLDRNLEMNALEIEHPQLELNYTDLKNTI